MKSANCDKLRKDSVEIVKDNLHTLGSSAKRTYLPTILRFFKSDEVELRIAAADAIGMIGPQDSDVELLAPLTNDPVPDVRMPYRTCSPTGKAAPSLLGQRVMPDANGRTPDMPADPAKFPAGAPQSTYLFYASDRYGRSGVLCRQGSEVTPRHSLKARPRKARSSSMNSRKNTASSSDGEDAPIKATETTAKQNENLKPRSNEHASLDGVHAKN